jgi:hypothetical protein
MNIEGKITPDTVEFTLYCHENPFHSYYCPTRETIDGKICGDNIVSNEFPNWITLHDVDLRSYEKFLLEARSNPWAWCLPTLHAKWGPIEVTVTLGAIYTGTRKDFQECSEFTEMKVEALTKLRKHATDILTTSTK